MLYNNCILLKQCILHTPTAIDMYCKRSKLLKKQGNVARAAGSPLAALCHCRNGSSDLTPLFCSSVETMDECRLLDLQDRYLNNKTTKYLLRNDEMERAMATIAMFTKHEGDSQKILYDLQCSWSSMAEEIFL